MSREFRMKIPKDVILPSKVAESEPDLGLGEALLQLTQQHHWFRNHLYNWCPNHHWKLCPKFLWKCILRWMVQDDASRLVQCLRVLFLVFLGRKDFHGFYLWAMVSKYSYYSRRFFLGWVDSSIFEPPSNFPVSFLVPLSNFCHWLMVEVRERVVTHRTLIFFINPSAFAPLIFSVTRG